MPKKEIVEIVSEEKQNKPTGTMKCSSKHPFSEIMPN